MVSISKKTTKTIVKIGLLILFVYATYFFIQKGTKVYKSKDLKQNLENKITIAKNKTSNIKRQIVLLQQDRQRLQRVYVSQAELEKKIQNIYKRMSVFDYKLKFISAKKMCIDRYIIISQLTSSTKKGQKAGLGILKYLGETHKSGKSDTIYFTNFISKRKDKR